MDGFITITDTKVVKFVVNTGTGKNYKKKTKWTKIRSLVKISKIYCLAYE